jgi:hypothetical protein
MNAPWLTLCPFLNIETYIAEKRKRKKEGMALCRLRRAEISASRLQFIAKKMSKEDSFCFTSFSSPSLLANYSRHREATTTLGIFFFVYLISY